MKLRGILAIRPTSPADSWRRLFIGGAGLRAGWRAALFTVIFGVVLTPPLFLLAHLPVVRQWTKLLVSAPDGLLPSFFALNEALLLLPTVAATWVMAFLENVSPASYGLQSESAAGRLAWGGLAGFLGLSLLTGILLADGNAVLTAGRTGFAAACGFGLAWLAVFCMVAVTEEMVFRGYLLHTLARGAGFWPAAFLTSLLFGLGHGHNPGETPVGQIGVIALGFVLCLSIRQTGSLFWAIGFHALWDWSESFFYGCHDSGVSSAGRFMDFLPRGNVYVSGGATGPEGSVFVFLVCGVLVALLLGVQGLKPRPPEALKS